MSKPVMLDLFSGIGGFSLAGAWAGFETGAFCEIDPFCQKVLRKNFGGIPCFGDIRTVTAESLRNVGVDRVDLVTGGFPCQPFSLAGKRRSKTDDRYLWPEMRRVIREVRPSWVVGENVSGIINLALDDVLSQLEEDGYEAGAVVIPACAVNAPHRRDRVWIVAQDAVGGSHGGESRRRRDGEQRDVSAGSHERLFDSADECDAAHADDNQPQQPGRNTERRSSTPEPRSSTGIGASRRNHGRASAEGTSADRRNPAVLQEAAADTHDSGCQQQRRRESIQQALTTLECETWRQVEPLVCRGDDGVSARMDGRVSRLKGLGNAIVPQVAYEILRPIAEWLSA